MQKAHRILIVDDDPDITKLLEVYLINEGYEVEVAFTEQEMMTCLKQGNFDLVLLDILLPDGDGFAITRWLREQTNTAIILISKKNTDIDQIVGLELGADDYVVKPLEPRALLARIKSVLRRYKLADASISTDASGIDAPVDENILRVAEWELDTATHRLLNDNGTQHILSANETSLLAYLVRNKGRVLSRNELMLEVSGREWEYMDRTIDIMVVRLRKILAGVSGKPSMIQTVRGIGYVFQIPKDPINGARSNRVENDRKQG